MTNQSFFLKWPLSSFLFAALTVFALIATTVQVQAMGYASLTCEELWERKQEIYRSNSYCLTDEAAIAKFGNDGCRFKELSEVSFSGADTNKLDLIARNEERKSCPKATRQVSE